MPLTAAQQAVFDQLAAEPGPVTWTGPATPGRWRASIRSGGGAGADPATITFRKSQAFPGGELHAVAFTRRGRRRPEHGLARAWQQSDGTWTAALAGSGEGDGPSRDRPRVNFTTAWDAHHFAGSGDVTGAGQARRVRLTFADGTTLADTVDNGVVLFWTSPGVTFPAHIEIHDAAGEVLAAYDDFDYLT
ncbi:MAG: hypothetical protein ACR2MP_16065 [Streptosporangiaceae bacterium]